MASAYCILGIQETLGRLESVVFSLLALWLVYALSKKIANEKVGLWAAFFFAILPMPVFFGRAIMPESLLVLTGTGGVYFFLRWQKEGLMRFILASGFLIALACLIKPPALCLGLPLTYLAFRKYATGGIRLGHLLAFCVLVIAPLVLWYYHAHRLRTQTGLTFGVWGYGTDKWGNWDLVLSWRFWQRILQERISLQYLSYLGVPVVAWGLLIKPESRDERVMLLWLVAMLIVVIIVAKGVFVHDYYLLLAIVPFCYYLGKVYSKHFAALEASRSWIRIGLCACLIGLVAVSIRTHSKFLRREDPASSGVLKVAGVAREKLPEDARVVAVDRGDPAMLYLAHKRGWRSFPRDLTRGFLDALAAQGAQDILGVHRDFERDGQQRHLARILVEQDRVVFDNGMYFIVRLAR